MADQQESTQAKEHQAKPARLPAGVVRHTYPAGDGAEQARYGLRVGKDQVVWLGPASDVAGLDDLEG